MVRTITRASQDIEKPVEAATGPLDVCEVNHHPYYDAMSTGFLRAVTPRVFIIQACEPSHPTPGTLARMLSQEIYSGQRDIFTTNLMQQTKMKSQQGHVVIRVEPGGQSYRIFNLDDSEESYKVKAVFGPYTSR